MTDDLRQKIRGVLASLAGMYVGSDIPAKKLANARAECKVPVGELIIGLLDCTMFGSAKHAVLFGDRVYIFEGWAVVTLERPLVMEYDELTTLEVIGARLRIPSQQIDVPRHSFSKRTIEALLAVKQVIPIRAPIAAPVELDPDDIRANPTAVALQDAIASAPDDEAPQLVLADLLLSVDDPRGELIVFDNRERETPDGLTDPDALERFLLLAAEYSFPRARAEEPTLPFYGHGSFPVRYTVTHAGRMHDLRYQRSQLTVSTDTVEALSCRLVLQHRDAWTVDEAIVILRLVSDAIRADTPLKWLQFPFGARKPLPIYEGGPLRGYSLPKAFTEPRGIQPDRYGLAARDYHRWMAIWLRLARARKGSQG